MSSKKLHCSLVFFDEHHSKNKTHEQYDYEYQQKVLGEMQNTQKRPAIQAS